MLFAAFACLLNRRFSGCLKSHATVPLLEVGTDWVKFCLIVKFSELQASTLEIYKEVFIADILLGL